MTIDERRELVRRMLAQHARPTDIARFLGVSPATVAKDARYQPQTIACAICGSPMRKLRKDVTCSPACSAERKREVARTRAGAARALPGPAAAGITVEQFLEERRPKWARSTP